MGIWILVLVSEKADPPVWGPDQWTTAVQIRAGEKARKPRKKSHQNGSQGVKMR